MSRTVRRSSVVQSVRNAAHNLLLFRCAIHCQMQPLKSYNRMQMQLASSAAFPEPLLAAMPQLKEKPHMGVPSKNPALYQGHEVCNSTTALGFQAALHLERIRSRYTGKERDTESGNDYMFARYYNSATGRFTTPDWSAKVVPVPYAQMGDPQSLNLYAYVGNNPITHVDPDGHLQCNGQACKADEMGKEFDKESEEKTKLVAQQQSGQQEQWNHDVVLKGEGKDNGPAPQQDGAFFVTKWVPYKIKDGKLQGPLNDPDAKVHLEESTNGGPFQSKGTHAGHGVDNFASMGKGLTDPVNQHWYLNGAHVQLVTGTNSATGKPTLAWEIHIERDVDMPHYSTVHPGDQ